MYIVIIDPEHHSYHVWFAISGVFQKFRLPRAALVEQPGSSHTDLEDDGAGKSMGEIPGVGSMIKGGNMTYKWESSAVTTWGVNIIWAIAGTVIKSIRTLV